MMKTSYFTILTRAIKQEWLLWISIAFGFLVLYYAGLLLAAMVRFNEIPNYIEVYDIVEVYKQILVGTPALSDAIPILLDEAWFETGYKNPDYYGVATWSYMLIPPKMLLVLFAALLISTFVVLVTYSRKHSCSIKNNKKLYTMAGVGTGLVGLTSATLSWVVCCAAPSWVVGLAMLGLSSTIALWLEPFGKLLSVVGIALVIGIIFVQLKNIRNNTLEHMAAE
ncbi:MAG: hypothetical protein P8Y28_16030 [Gammaproteobacteria bacterium]|jgi:hypothetical protein